MRILVSIHAARFIPSEFLKDLFNWTRNTGKHQVYFESHNSSGMIGWSRSLGIESARRQGMDLLIELDTDVRIDNTFTEVIGFINQDIARRFDIVVGPTVGINGRVMIHYTDDMIKAGAPPSGKSAFEVKASAFGFVAFSKRYIDSVRPIDMIADLTGKQYPLYMVHRAGTTEDYVACYEAANQKMRTCVDPRIKVAHYKFTPLYVGWVDDDPNLRVNGIRLTPSGPAPSEQNSGEEAD